MERLNQNLAKEVARYFKVKILAPRGAEDFAPQADKVLTCPSSASLFLACAIAKSFILALKARFSIRIDVVLAGSGVTAPPAFVLAKLSGARLGVYLHGLDVVVKSPLYRAIFLPLIRRADFWIANSTATKRHCIDAGMPGEKISVIHPGVDIPETDLRSSSVTQLATEKSLPGHPILISVGRLTRRKGVKEFIQHSLPQIVARHPETMFLVAGSVPKHALLKNHVTKEEIENAARTAGVSHNVRLMGPISEEELASLYRAADVHVFPLIPIEGDMEGFGMVAIESAAWGVPTVAFAEGGVVDAVSEGVSGLLIASGNYTQFSCRVCDILDGKVVFPADQMKSFADEFRWEVFGKQVSECVFDNA